VSLCPSVKRVNCDKTDEKSVQILYRTIDHLAYFSEKKNGWWGRPLLPEILGQSDHVGAKYTIFYLFLLAVPQP